jgi:hypothetical protein
MHRGAGVNRPYGLVLMIDFSSLLAQILPVLWWLLPLFFIAALFKSALFKGVIGEAMIHMAARLFLNKHDYHLIKHVTILAGGGSIRIDHIIVSRFGLFVVEIKNMKGLVFGSEDQKTWTLRRFKSARTFQNPLHQIYKHTKTMEDVFGLEPGKMFSIVVFVGECAFATPMPDNVIYGGRYIRYIKSKTEVLLTDTEMQQIIQQIADGHLEPSLKNHLRHAQHVRETMAAKYEPDVSAAKLCPECGSTMVLLTVEIGPEPGSQFWGCSTFPKCTAIDDIG